MDCSLLIRLFYLKKRTTAAGFLSIGMDMLSFYFKSYLIIGSLCCAFSHFLLFCIGHKIPQIVGWFFFIIIVVIQTTDLNRSRSPWSTSQSYFIIDILPQGIMLTLLPLQVHLFHLSHHPSLPKTLPFNLLKDTPVWLIVPEKPFQFRYENAYKIKPQPDRRLPFTAHCVIS